MSPHRIIEIGADRFANGYLKYGDGRRELFCNFVLGAPPEALGAGAGLPEPVLLDLAYAGALPPVRVTADRRGRWPGPPGPLLDCWRYRKIVAAWWRRRRPPREAQRGSQRSGRRPTEREDDKTRLRPSQRH